MQTVTEMANFVKLWDLVQDIQLIAEHGGGFLMENIQRCCQPTPHNSWGLTVGSMANTFGKHNMTAKPSSLPSSWYTNILTSDNLMARQWRATQFAAYAI